VNFQDYLKQLNTMRSRYNRVSDLLTYEEVALDNKLSLKLTKEKQQLFPIVEKYEKYLKLQTDLNECEELLKLSQNDKDIFVKEVDKINYEIESLKKDIINSFINAEAKWDNIVIEVILNGTVFGEDIINSYIKYLKNNDLEFLSHKEKDVIKIFVQGFNIKNIFIQEIGQHIDDKNNIIQVFVYDNLETNESFNVEDVVITTCRSSGAGGQHINTTDSAIRAVHLPTGISVTCQSERSQMQNKKIALDNLKNRVNNHYEKEKQLKITELKKEQLKLMRNKQFVKTYNYYAGIIIAKDKREIKLKDFLIGKEI